MIIEFTGFAGVGKSYIRKFLQKELEKKNYNVISDSTFPKINYLNPMNAILLFQSIFYIKKIKPKNNKAWLQSSIVWYKIQCKLKYYHHFKGIVLIDEGYIHKFRFLRRNSLLSTLNLDNKYKFFFNKPDIIILIEADINTLKFQVKKRDEIELNITIGDYTKSIDKTKKDIKILIEKNKHIKYLNLKNDISFNIDKLIKEICG